MTAINTTSIVMAIIVVILILDWPRILFQRYSDRRRRKIKRGIRAFLKWQRQHPAAPVEDWPGWDDTSWGDGYCPTVFMGVDILPLLKDKGA